MIWTAIAVAIAMGPTPGADSARDTAASAQLRADAPRAELKVFASDGRRANRGDAFNGSSATLCVASTTGRYRLRVLSISGGVMRGRDARVALSYRVRFRDASGAEQVKQMTDGEIFFEGRSPGDADCSGGANAFVLIDSPESAVQASVAGEYADRLTLIAEPL